MKKSLSRVQGWSAIEAAKRIGITLNKYADPIEGERSGLSIEEAERISKVDPSLLWIDTGYDLFQTNSGGLCLVNRGAGDGFCGFEIGQNRGNRLARDEFTFRGDTGWTPGYGSHYHQLGDASAYTRMRAEDVERLYEQLGDTDAADLVARREGDEITILHSNIGTSARWYLAEDAPKNEGSEVQS